MPKNSLIGLGAGVLRIVLPSLSFFLLLELSHKLLFLSLLLYAKELFLIGLGAGVLRIFLPSLSFFLLLELSHKLLFLSLLLFVAFSCVHRHEHLAFALFVFSPSLILFLLLIKKKKFTNYI